MKMRGFSELFGFCLLFCAVAALPTNHPDDDAEVVVVPLEHQGHPEIETVPEQPDFNNFDGVIATDYHPGFFTFSTLNPYAWNFDFLSRIQDVFRGLISPVWSYGPQTHIEPEWATDGNNNSTSTVEIVDGHKIITNDTFITKKTNFGESIFKVRTVEVLPLDDDNSTNNGTVTDGETTIKPNNKHEDTEKEGNYSPEELEPPSHHNEISHDIDAVESFELDDIDNHQRPQDHQYMNKLEAFEPAIQDSSSMEHKWETFEDNENLDIYEQIPVDLSNDIAVNQMLADQGAPFNPDAEIFNVDEQQQQQQLSYQYVPLPLDNIKK